MIILGFILVNFSQFMNALCDAMVFSGYKITVKRDFWWHIFKWILDRPVMFLAGVFFADEIKAYFNFIVTDFYYAIFHYTTGIVVFFASVALSVFIWQYSYRKFKDYFRRIL